MATLLDAPRPSAKVEEFVERQLAAARRRVRVLDFFLAGLSLAVGSLVILLAGLLVHRYVALPDGTWWAVVAGYIALATGYLYLTLFHPNRRQINPYFVARQVELNVPDAKNSLVTFVDFEEDPKLPGSIKTAISQKAARDLKKVDLNRAIENRKVLWLAGAAGVLLLASVVVAFLPPTRTELKLQQPKGGDITVFNNQEVTFEVHVGGRIPNPNEADAVRLRMWYNPDDPDNYEDRPLKAVEGDRRQFALTVPPKQVRNGFRYRILAGDTQTDEFTVTCKIIPEFTQFDVNYHYPEYLKQADTQSNDPNLVAPYDTEATITVGTNRTVAHGHIEIEGEARTIDGKVVQDQAIQFVVPMKKDGFFRIWYTTPEGDKNQDPARLRLTVIDPKPIFRSFDVAYEYPAYLRFKPMTVADVREPEIDAPQGSKVVLTAKTTRAVKDAKLEIEGQPAIVGELVVDQPTWARFRLPAIEKDAVARVSFTPNTSEAASGSKSIPIHAIADERPTVRLTQPEPDLVEIPANGTLDLKGDATDDHGVDKLTLKMKVAGEDVDLKPKPYRNGMSFLRKEDNSWPTKVEYKDFIKLADLRAERNANWRVTPGIEIEYWLEALDNRNIPPGPNVGRSAAKRFKVTAPVTKPDEQKKIEQKNAKAEREQKAHERRQDEQNNAEKRDVQQQPPKGAEQQPQEANAQQKKPEPGNAGQAKPEQGDKPQDTNAERREGGNDGNPQDGNPDQDAQRRAVEEAIKKSEQEKNAAGSKGGPNQPAPDAKVEPGEERKQPGTGPMDPPPAEQRQPKTDPNSDMSGGGAAGENKSGKIDNTKEEKGDAKDGGETQKGTEPEEKGTDHRPFGGSGQEQAGQQKPDSTSGSQPKGSDDKGAVHPDQKPDAKDPMGGGSSSPKSAEKPEKDVTRSDNKGASGQPGQGEEKPPQDVADNKPQKSEDPAGSRPQPKNDDVADKGGSRGGPKEDSGASEERPSKEPMGGSKDDVAKGGTKGGPGQPSGQQNGEQNAEQGELDREMGELSREINSKNPKVSDKAKDDVSRLMRNPKTREKAREELDKLEKNAPDELSRKKAQDLKQSGEQAAKNYDNERPNEENMDRLSKKLNSDDKKERGDAEQRLKDWQKNPETKKELEEQNERLAKKDRQAADRVKNAMEKNERASKEPGNSGDQPKMDEKDLQKLAKDLNGSDEKAKADARQKLENAAKDPKQAKAMQDKLNEMAKNATGEDKKNLENAAQQAGKMADEMVKKEPTPNGDNKIDPKDLKDAAEKLASGDPKAQKEAKEKLEQMMKDPQAAKEARDKLNEMAKNAKTPEEKKALEDAAKAADQMAKGQPEGPKDKPGPKPDDLKNLADKMAGQDPKAKEDAQKQLQEMMKDPKTREQALKQLEEMAKNAKPEDQKALQDALKQAAEMAKNQPNPPKADPKDLQELAKEFQKMGPEAKENLRKQMEEAMKDPETRKKMEEAMKELANKQKTPEEQKQLDQMFNQLGGGFPEMATKPDPADPRNKLKAAELTLERFKKDEKVREQLHWTDEQIEKFIKDQEALIAALRKQSEKGDWRSDRNVRGGLPGGPVKADFNPTGSGDGSRGTRAAPPSGYGDPYKKFTTDQSGGAKAGESKR